MVVKQSGAASELLHCHVTLTLEAFMRRAVTFVGVGGAGSGKNNAVNCMQMQIYTTSTHFLLVDKPFWEHCFINLTAFNVDPDGVLCVAL